MKALTPQPLPECTLEYGRHIEHLLDAHSDAAALLHNWQKLNDRWEVHGSREPARQKSIWFKWRADDDRLRNLVAEAEREYREALARMFLSNPRKEVPDAA